MKLRDFLNYRTHCLSCGLDLNTSFHSQKRQKHLDFNNRLLIQMDLKNLKRKQAHYKVGYSIDYDSNDFCIEFFDDTGKYWYEKESPIFLINRFKELDKNHGKYSITKHCNICNRYWYQSNYFELDYKTSNLGDLSIQLEYGVFIKPHDDGYIFYRLHSHYDKKESTFETTNVDMEYWKFFNCEKIDPPFDFNRIKTNTILFKESSKSMIDRLDKLILFS